MLTAGVARSLNVFCKRRSRFELVRWEIGDRIFWNGRSRFDLVRVGNAIALLGVDIGDRALI